MVAYIQTWSEMLEDTFGAPRAKVTIDQFSGFEVCAEPAKAMARLKRLMDIDGFVFRLGLVNSGGPENAGVWMPKVESTTEFTLYVRRTMLAETSPEVLLTSMAMALSYAYLVSCQHPEATNEQFVEVAAIHFGGLDLLKISRLKMEQQVENKLKEIRKKLMRVQENGLSVEKDDGCREVDEPQQEDELTVEKCSHLTDDEFERAVELYEARQ